MNTGEDSQAWSYPTLRATLQRSDDGIYSAQYGSYRLGSHFQPIVSLTHARVIGHEGLIRPVDADLKPMAPPVLLAQTHDSADELLKLDRLSRLLHMANISEAQEGWLFLNMHPRIFATERNLDTSGFTRYACREFGIDRGHIVIEILENALRDEVEFAETIRNIRSHGYLVALDDFGAGHSNFDRVWKLAPEIVKLDRVFAVGVEHDARIRRLLPRIVALLHEAGVFVVLEGIETRTQALVALDSNVDFAQGEYFANPQPTPLKIHSLVHSAAELWRNYDSEIVEQQRLLDARLAPYRNALAQVTQRLAAGLPFARACSPFLSLPYAELCFLLDSNGRQIGTNIWHPAYTPDIQGARFRPVSNIGGARWSRRPYFRQAMENVGKPQSTQPYLSVASGHVCITVSLAFQQGKELQVLCGDIAWE